MTKERLEEISNYYKMSIDFLENVLKEAPETAKENDIEKVNTTLSLFKDTYDIIVDYSKKIEYQQS
jgi:hypothetical protein